MKCRWRSLTAALLSVSLLLTGCSAGTSSGSADAGDGDGIVEVHDSQTQVTCSWWGNDNRHEYMLDGLRLFQEKEPDITVKPTYGVWDGYEDRNRIFMKSHTCPDVMLINYSWLQEYSPEGTGYYDLNDLKQYIDLSDFTDRDIEMGTVNGRLNALPTAYNTVVFFYNKSVYDHYGLDIPKTWDDLFNAAEVMKEDGIYPMGFVRKHMFLALVAWYEQTTGKDLFNEDGEILLNRTAVEKMLEFYRSLVDNGVVERADAFSSSQFSSGEVAGVGCWISDVSVYAPDGDKDADIVLGPQITKPDTDSDRYGWYVKPATMYAVSADTSCPEQAAKLLDFLLNDRDMALLQGTEKGVPCSAAAKAALEDADMLTSLQSKATDQMNENMTKMKTMPTDAENADIIEAFRDAGDRYILGECSMSEAATEVMDAVNARD